MSDNTTAARPYAKAVFEMAQAESKQKEWSDVLALLTDVVNNEEMRDVLQMPQMGAAAKGGLLIDICSDKLSDSNRNFVKLLAENGRLSLMTEIFTLYEELRAEAESKIEASVRSAYPLTDIQIKAMTEALKKKLGCDVTLVTEIDTTLIGGVVIKAGDLVIDGSAQARLDSLAYTLSH